MTEITLQYEASPPAAAAPLAGDQPFRFTGTAREYFGIWIVNLFLTLVTLGIYSAWAKVRKKRYLYGSTWLAGSNFEYHGQPLAILKGRIVALVAFVAYTLLTHFSPRLGAVLLLALMPAVPWLIVRSFAFNAVNSSYRNLRFHFNGTYREGVAAIWPFFAVAAVGVLVPDVEPGQKMGFGDVWFLFLTPLAAALSYPYVVAKIKLLQANRASFGTASFACDAPVSAFYAIYAMSFVMLFFSLVVLVAFGMMLATVADAMLMVFIPAAYFVLAALALAYTRARVANRLFNATTLAGGGRFVSTLSARTLAKLYATNLLAITCTLGLAVPWAVIRTARYRAECLSLQSRGDFESFVGGVARGVAATGEELGEMFDLDLSL